MTQTSLRIEYLCLIYLSFWIYGFHGYGYIGCFVDQAPPMRTLPVFELKYDLLMTNEKCAMFCCSSSSTITFFGTEAWDCCHCGNQTDASSFVPAAWQDCNMPCTGNHLQVCGGSYRLSIYQINCTLSTTTNSQQSATSAVTTVTTHNVQGLDSKITQIVNDIKIDKTNTSSYLNRKRSVADSRISSLAIGVVGIIVIVTPTILIVFGDLSKCLFCKRVERKDNVANG